MPGGSGDYEADGDDRDERDIIPTPSQGPRPATEFERCDQGTRDVGGYEGEDGNNGDPDAD